MAESLSTVLIELAIYTTLWMIVHEAFYRLLPIPASVKKLEGKDKDDKERNATLGLYVSYYPALLHAPVTTLVGIFCLCYYGVSYGLPTKGLEIFPIKYSASFFLHDTINGIRRKYNDRVVLAHHILIITVLVYAWTKGMYGNDVCNGIAQGEITNPIYAVYDVMTHLGYEEATIRPLGIAFLASFIIIRLFVCPMEMWKMQHSEADIFFKLAYTGMWTISMMLIWMMLNKIAKLFSQVALLLI
jgi:hypothetical protein